MAHCGPREQSWRDLRRIWVQVSSFEPAVYHATCPLRNQTHNNAFAVQSVPGVCLRAFDLAVPVLPITEPVRDATRSEFGSVFDLASMEPPAVGRYGVALKSIWRSETEGTTFALTCGDFNGDGLADVALGDSAAGGRGHVYVVFGSSSESEGPLDLAELDGENGFAVAGLRNGDRFGFSVALNGDVNDDGLKDLVIGAPGQRPASLCSCGDVRLRIQ